MLLTSRPPSLPLCPTTFSPLLICFAQREAWALRYIAVHLARVMSDNSRPEFKQISRPDATTTIAPLFAGGGNHPSRVRVYHYLIRSRNEPPNDTL